MSNHIQESADYIASYLKETVDTAIVLGSGLGSLASDMEIDTEIDYSLIPNFPVSTVEGHSGKLILGKLAGKVVLVMKGRFHYYEGYSMKEVTFPLRVMQQLGVKNLVLSNAAGGLNPSFSIGDLMLITDHINAFPENPLRGKNDPAQGTRFPDMSEAYNKEFREQVLDIAAQHNIAIRQGVYIGTPGPSYETPAECRYFRMIGADAVGMSTVPEVIVARHAGMRVVAFSVITNLNFPDEMKNVSHEDVQKVAADAEPKLKFLLQQLIKRF